MCRRLLTVVHSRFAPRELPFSIAYSQLSSNDAFRFRTKRQFQIVDNSIEPPENVIRLLDPV